MTDMSRRGFLALLGATGALATLPGSVVETITDPVPPPARRWLQGLFLRDATGRVYSLGTIQLLTVPKRKVDLSHSMYAGRAFSTPRIEPPELDFRMHGSLQDVHEAHQAFNHTLDTAYNSAGGAAGYFDMLAVMRTTDHAHDTAPHRIPGNGRVQVRNGDLVLAMQRTFIRQFEITYTPELSDSETPFDLNVIGNGDIATFVCSPERVAEAQQLTWVRDTLLLEAG